MTEETLVGFIFLVLGGLQAIRPDILLGFQTWTQRVVMGAKYEPGPRTYTIVRSLGVAFSVLGLLLITRAIP